MQLMDFWNEYGALIMKGTGETLFMTAVSTFFACLLGLPLGVVLVVTGKGHILEQPKLNATLGWVVNTARSLPFIILLIAIIPFTRLVAGTTIGPVASTVPLIIGAIPFVARLAETALRETDAGMIEAAQSMGASPLSIVRKVMIPETLPSLIRGISIVAITLVGYSAMAGMCGGGGLGDLAIRYGYYRYQKNLMFATILLLIVLVQLIQSAGSLAAARVDRRTR